MTAVTGYDITAANYQHRPVEGQPAFYITGTPDIRATPAMLAAYPHAVLIDQSPVIDDRDITADAFDMETGAVTIGEIGTVMREALTARKQETRIGQRLPLAYASVSNMNAVTTAMDAAGLRGSGAGLWLAHWGITLAQAEALIDMSYNGYPVRAVQLVNDEAYDFDVFSAAWLGNHIAEIPPGQWNPDGQWTWKQCVITGTDVHGNLRSWAWNPVTGGWGKSLA